MIYEGKRAPVRPEGVVSTLNASSTLITNGSNYTGTWEDGGGYDSLTVAVATDQDGYYEVQFSPDGTNTDSTLTRYYRTDLINPPHRFTITRRYFRVRFFNNSGSDQTYFRLQVLLGVKNSLNVPLGGIVSNDYDAEVSRPDDYDHAVARGLWQGRSTWVKFGYNQDVSSSAPEVLASFGGTYTPLTSAAAMEVLSSDANDTNSSGTGARTVLIYGVDSNGELATESVALNGTTAVATANSYFGINRLVVLTSGSGQVNAGTITVRVASAGATHAEIPLGKGVTQQCIFTVPAGHDAMINDILLNCRKLSGGTAPRVTFRGWVYNRGTTATKYQIFRLDVDTAVENTVTLFKKQPLILNPTDVFWLQLETNANNTIATARFGLSLIRRNST